VRILYVFPRRDPSYIYIYIYIYRERERERERESCTRPEYNKHRDLLTWAGDEKGSSRINKAVIQEIESQTSTKHMAMMLTNQDSKKHKIKCD
jgi:hypothetical protein